MFFVLSTIKAFNYIKTTTMKRMRKQSCKTHNGNLIQLPSH